MTHTIGTPDLSQQEFDRAKPLSAGLLSKFKEMPLDPTVEANIELYQLIAETDDVEVFLDAVGEQRGFYSRVLRILIASNSTE